MKIALVLLIMALSAFGARHSARAEIWKCSGGVFTSNPAQGQRCKPLSVETKRGTDGERIFGQKGALRGYQTSNRHSGGGQAVQSGVVFSTADERKLESTTSKQELPAPPRRRCGG